MRKRQYQMTASDRNKANKTQKKNLNFLYEKYTALVLTGRSFEPIISPFDTFHPIIVRLMPTEPHDAASSVQYRDGITPPQEEKSYAPRRNHV